MIVCVLAHDLVRAVTGGDALLLDASGKVRAAALRASQAGVRVGMRLRQAQALYPEAEVHRFDPEPFRQMVRELTSTLARFSDRMEVAPDFWQPGQSKRRAQPIHPSAAVICVDLGRLRDYTLLAGKMDRSAATCQVAGDTIRLGFNYVAGMGDAAISRLLAARERGHFTDLADLQRRAKLPRRVLENLILSGALDAWGERRALARAAQVTGVSTGPHVLALYRADLLRRGVLGSRDVAACPHGQSVAVAGLVMMHQAPPTAKGFHFITLEDEDGMLNVIVRPDVYARYRRAIRGAALLLVAGALQIEGDVVNVLAAGFAADRRSVCIVSLSLSVILSHVVMGEVKYTHYCP